MHIDDMGGFEDVLLGAMTIQTYTTPDIVFHDNTDLHHPGNRVPDVL